MNKSNNQQTSLNVFFDTLGCAKNEVDTFKMECLVRDSGFNVVEDASFADVIILNTCAFIEAATQESIDIFFEYRNYYKDKKIIVCGCLVSRYKDELEKSLSEADAFVSCSDENKICDLIRDFNLKPSKENEKKGTSASVFGYVKISDGCNRKCSYCTIPLIRGKYKSSIYDEIVKDVKEQRDLGAKEVVLVAQDCGVWGCDLDGKNLAWLTNSLCKDFPNLKFRLLYIYPETINDDLVDSFKNNKNLINYIDMPMQHCNAEILKAMGRRGDRDTFTSLVGKLRRNIPDVTLRSTFICGFPGESYDAFDELCDFIEEIKLDYTGCFEYSCEEGTKAALMDCQVDATDKYSRTNRLREIADEISLNKIGELVGESFDVLIEGIEEGRYYGRAYFQAPDIDGVVFISEFEDKKITIGDYLNVKILDTEGYDLVGAVND